MRKVWIVLAATIAVLMVFNACTVEIPTTPSEETTSASSVYEAVSTLFDLEVEASYTGVVRGVVVHSYSTSYGNVALIQDPDGRAGLRVELKEGEDSPNAGSYIEVYGLVRKYYKSYEDVNTFKMQDATYTVVEESTDLVSQPVDETFFATENCYKMNVFVQAEGTVTGVATGSYPKIYMDIDVGDMTKNIAVFSYDNEVKDWMNAQGETLVGTLLEVYGYWSKYRDDWEIIPRATNDIPAIGE
jgi:DNA/RNA endonuclease YhcR with UshA esterase domain